VLPAAGAPLNGTVEIAGPEVFAMDEWVRAGLAFRRDPREVVTDNDALYFGEKPGSDGLLPGPGAQLAAIYFTDWLPANSPGR
jgi:hypothetical protein